MSKLFLTEIDKLKSKTLALCALVEERLHLSVKSVLDVDSDLANTVIKGDEDVDQKEVEIEEECLKILALYQPVAADLRLVVAILKLNNDLERIGDLSASIAYRARDLFDLPRVNSNFNIPQLADKVKEVLRFSINSFVNLNPDLAREVMSSDDEIDRLNRTNLSEIQRSIKQDPEKIESYISLMIASRALERVGDHCTNIAEDVIYMVQGDIIRHRMA
ncbi:MAG: phosphate transport system regulatory protein PhoU [Proteobacteria bacterium]|nr:MAG: phosphate transport system regulatory protein PhoU [Pseudomonadota bacterium]